MLARREGLRVPQRLARDGACLVAEASTRQRRRLLPPAAAPYRVAMPAMPAAAAAPPPCPRQCHAQGAQGKVRGAPLKAKALCAALSCRT